MNLKKFARDQLVKRGFRCPFHKKAETDGTILTVTLTNDSAQRLKAMVEALRMFYADKKWVALEFVLPPELVASSNSLESLKIALMPYQCELVAAELEYRLYPFLPYQTLVPAGEMSFDQTVAYIAALQLADVWRHMTGGVLPASAKDVASWLFHTVALAMEGGARAPYFAIRVDPADPSKGDLLTIRLEGFALPYERMEDMADTEKNRNLFTIVTCPFYPREFGRFSEQVAFVMTREAQFTALSAEARKKIRRESNEVLCAHGVAIDDLEEERQDLGVWVPTLTESKKELA